MTATKSFVTMIPSSLFFVGLFGMMLCSRICMMAEVCGLIRLPRRTGVKSGYQVGPPDATETLFDIPPLLRFIPEEVLALGEFLFGSLCAEYLFQRVRVIACVPCLCGIGHRCRCEILYLFEMEVETFRDDRQFCHILFPATRVG